MASPLSLFSVSVVLLIYFTQHLGALCPPRPSVECEGDECQINNYLTIWEDRRNCTVANAAFPKSEDEFLNAVANAVKNNHKVRVVSKQAHSLAKLACVESQGLIISTEKYSSIISVNKSAMTITVQAGAMMRDVLEAAAKEGLALPAMIYWSGVSAGGVISTGAHGSGLGGKGSGVYEYVVGLRLIIPASSSEGYAKIITLTEGDKDLNAARLSLGTLGAISEVTFALEPMFKRSVSATVEDDANLENEAERHLKASDHAAMNWIPSHGKASMLTIYRVPVNVTGDGVNELTGSPSTVVDIETSTSEYDTMQAQEDVDGICKTLEDQIDNLQATGSGFLNDGKSFTGYPVVGFNHRMQTSGGCLGYATDNIPNTCTPTEILDKNETVCEWDRRVHHKLYFNVELRVPLSRLRELMIDVKKLRDLNPKRLCDINGIHIRSIKKSEAYLGPKEDVVAFELTLHRPREAGTPKWNEDVYQEMEQIVIEKYGGALHWAKSGGYLFGGLARRAVNLKEFLKVKERFDPAGVFSSEWTDGVLGIGGRGTAEWRDGCALDKMCKCREDRHCAPQKGFTCQRGRVWKAARVCRKVDSKR